MSKQAGKHAREQRAQLPDHPAARSAPDVQSPDFAAAAHTQSVAVANSEDEPDNQAFIAALSGVPNVNPDWSMPAGEWTSATSRRGLNSV